MSLPARPPDRPLVLCADDYGLAPGVSDGIAELITQGRLSATSVMVVGPDFARAAGALAGLRSHAGIGLHLTLTDRTPLGSMPRLAPGGAFPPLGALMRRAFSLQLDRAEIRAEFARQIDRFEAVTGFAPDFVDGHQHVHLLPVVRSALFDLFANARIAAGRTWLRDCAEPVARIRARGVAVSKSIVIAALARGLGARARSLGIATNQGFAGIYDFGAEPPFRHQMQAFLRTSGPAPLVMVHPGHIDPTLRALDPVVDARAREWTYLASPDFPTDLAAAGLRLTPRPAVA